MLAGSALSPTDRLERSPRPAAPDAPPKAADGPSFADHLQRQATHHAAARAESNASAAAAPPGDAAPAKVPGPGSGAAARARQRPQSAPRAQDGEAESAKPDCVAVDQGDASASQLAALTTGDGADGRAGIAKSEDPNAWLASVHRVPASDTPPASDDAQGTGGLAPAKGKAQAVTLAEDPLELGTQPSDSEAQAPGGAPTPPLQPGLDAGLTRREAASRRDALPGLPDSPFGSLARAAQATAPSPIVLEAAVYSPEFAQALGAQVSLFARDGVQQAELQLNPADMGPIGVQIEIDGKEARVVFSAGLGSTREVIERGLPELAAALREQGLSFAGGGVFDQAGDPQARPGRVPFASNGRQVRGAQASPSRAARTLLLDSPQGLLDLYA